MSPVRLPKAFIAGLFCGAAVTVGIAIAQGAPNDSVPLAVPIGQPQAQAPTTPSGPPPTGQGTAPRPSGPVNVPAPRIMVVDANLVLQKSRAGESIRHQLEAQQEAYRKEFDGRQREIDQDQAELERQQRSLSATDLEEKRLAFTRKVEQVTKEVDAKKRGLGKGADDATEKLQRALVEIIKGLAEERGANLVLLRNAAIMADPAYDVSEEALKRLDQKLPSVTLVISEAAAAADNAPPKKK